MTPRPRKKQNQGLPPNLYVVTKGNTYRYRHPITKKEHGMGSNRAKAIEAAKRLNSMLMPENDLVANVEMSETIERHVDWFKREIIPHKDYGRGTLSMYETRLKQIKTLLGSSTPVHAVSVRDIAEAMESMTPRPAQQFRQVAIDLFRAACGRGLIETNPAELSNKPVAKKQRERLTHKDFMKIHEAAPLWFQNAMDLALITLQRREDIANMKFEDIKDGALYVIQQKTQKHDTGYLKIEIGETLSKVISNCRDDIASPYLIHRKPEKRIRREGMHWTQIKPEMITREFKELADKLKIKNTSFHEIRALGIKLYKDMGIEPQQLAGHSSQKMTKNYDADHKEIRWTQVKTI